MIDEALDLVENFILLTITTINKFKITFVIDEITEAAICIPFINNIFALRLLQYLLESVPYINIFAKLS